jgi:acyl-CoA synthetase (AMP-forming)/AMP-acid ligase II
LTGYEGEAPGSSGFEPGGWFNTGDMGRMDDDGYLYVTGRTKEVINRGGEIISPVEIEEALA